ncbi:uncharacterized protein LACBIDRAFT_324478 [Laccaria bicolor S238N-H82]|uniref:Predicted protein n=1 Tax=Laccaria bicolor (strain S238N-H82 / ATCC MYA-4686) TaxID=486041 RepID=B0D1Y5_LACBS|nr:uncharacterized protein LACBIDRAFT_324478 [Laccaria bicolor S238N-H82]EDR12073.1 predicted protein [Laccaria bicolor S238N-H82]|eukprot:XP_001877970.1 predicted protein [Laccaria bicolor S238N-H82]
MPSQSGLSFFTDAISNVPRFTAYFGVSPAISEGPDIQRWTLSPLGTYMGVCGLVHLFDSYFTYNYSCHLSQTIRLKIHTLSLPGVASFNGYVLLPFTAVPYPCLASRSYSVGIVTTTSYAASNTQPTAAQRVPSWLEVWAHV